MSDHHYPPITRDPAAEGELIVTRLESLESGTVIEGRFSLGWIGRLTPEQLDFVGLLLKFRNNLQKLAGELGVAYNTARSRLDDVVAALGGESERPRWREPPVEDQMIQACAAGRLDPTFRKSVAPAGSVARQGRPDFGSRQPVDRLGPKVLTTRYERLGFSGPAQSEVRGRGSS